MILRISSKTADCLLPPKRIPTWEWICNNGVTKDGNPFNYLDYPWVRGLAEAWDSPHYERIFMRAGSRLGKTETALQFVISAIAQDPDFTLLGGPVEDKVKEWITDRLYPMLCRNFATRHWVPPQTRKGTGVALKLAHCTIYGAWSGSPTTLGDRDPRYLLGLEASKFSKNASEEADPLDLLLERGAEKPDRRVFVESTPTIVGKCRITKHVANGTDCRWYVPCPHCECHQPLQLGDRKAKQEGGLTWDKNEDGKSTPAIAYRTARYICCSCGKEIYDSQRQAMIRRGVMVPAGCQVTRSGQVVGTPINPGPDFSFALSRMYGATFSFARYARSFVEAAQDPDVRKLQSWLNNWAGIAWQPYEQTKEWEELADAITGPHDPGVCPEDTAFVTVGVDVQKNHWVWVAAAWNRRRQCRVIGYGNSFSWQELKDEVIKREWRHADGGPPLVAKMTLIDSRDGNRTDEVREFCSSANCTSSPWVFPCMGESRRLMAGRPFKKTPLDQATRKPKSRDTKNAVVDFAEITVDFNYYQIWIQNCIDSRKVEDDNNLSFHNDSKDDQDLWDQLLNEVPDWRADTSGHSQCVFVRVSKLIPVDLRDCCRYARCAADVYTNMQWNRVAERRQLTHTNELIEPPNPSSGRRSPGVHSSQPRWLRKLGRRIR